MSEITLVVYAPDQGFYLGEHGWLDKRCMYEDFFKMPFLIKCIDVIKYGTFSKEKVMNIDFGPIFLDFDRIEVPKNIQGESFKTLFIIILKSEEIQYINTITNIQFGIRFNLININSKYKLIHFYYSMY